MQVIANKVTWLNPEFSVNRIGTRKSSKKKIVENWMNIPAFGYENGKRIILEAYLLIRFECNAHHIEFFSSESVTNGNVF